MVKRVSRNGRTALLKRGFKRGIEPDRTTVMRCFLAAIGIDGKLVVRNAKYGSDVGVGSVAPPPVPMIV
jgi:hypothetical protein